MAQSTSLVDALGGEQPTMTTALVAVENDLFPKDDANNPIPDAGLNGVFEMDHPVEFNQAFPNDPVGEMFGRGLSAVPWQVATRHTGEFRGIPATGKPVAIVGVSILDLTDRSGPGLIHRFVNWEEVMGQLGVVYAARASAPEPPATTP